MPDLDALRKNFRAGMSKDEFYAACDDLMEHGPLQLGMPTMDENLITVTVDEGDAVLFFLSDEKGLVYAEYKGDVFLEADE